MVHNRLYYKSEYTPGNWREGLSTVDLKIQVNQVVSKHRQGMGMLPYESTAAALAQLLSKADTFVTAMGIEMQGLVTQVNELAANKGIMQARIDELEETNGEVAEEVAGLQASLKAANDKIAALKEAASVSVQPEVVNEVRPGVPLDTPAKGGRKPSRTKPAAKRNR